MTDGVPHVIGLISDTHGLVRPDVHTALAGVELILHAGDVGGADVLNELGLIAPVRAARGNTDPPDDPPLPSSIDLIVGDVSIHVSHGHEVGSPNPQKLLARYDADVIVYGHTHKQLVARAAERWVVNPGAAGPRRFDLMPSVAKLTIRGREIEVETLDLAP
jgi:putative phosphoesterase